MSVPQYEFTELEEEVFDENMDYGVQQSNYNELYNEAESGTSTRLQGCRRGPGIRSGDGGRMTPCTGGRTREGRLSESWE